MTPQHPMSSWAADWIGELQRFAPRVRRPAGARATQLAECEALLGRPLPADARACYAAANGDVRLWPGTWLNLHRVALRHRLMCTVAEHLRPGEPGWTASDEPLRPDVAVRRGAWHAGWIPIGENFAGGQIEYLCLDTAPGPAGRWGQLIVVQDPTWLLARGEPVPPARRLADGLLPHFWLVLQTLRAAAAPLGTLPAHAAGAVEPPAMPLAQRLLADPLGLRVHVPAAWLLEEGRARFDTSPFWPAWCEATCDAPQRLAAASSGVAVGARRGVAWVDASLSDAALAAALRAMNEPWVDGPVPRVPLPRPLTLLNLAQPGEAHEPIPPSTLDWWGIGCRREGLERLRAWAAGTAPPRGLLLGAAGVGKTTLLRELAESRSADEARPLLRIDLATLVDWQAEPPRAPASLAEILRMQARRRGLDLDARALLAALAADRFALVLDQVEALAPCQPDVWRMADDLPGGSSARILMVCAREWFVDGARLREAVDGLALWPLDGPRGHWLACLHDPVLGGLRPDELCRLFGIEAARAAEVGDALRAAGLGGAPGGVIVARDAPPRQDPDGPAGSTDMALGVGISQRWCRSRLPVSGRWEREHAEGIVAELATALARRQVRSCPPGNAVVSIARLDDLLRRRCKGLSGQRLERLRLHLLQALVLQQRFPGQVQSEGGVVAYWPAIELVQAMASDDEGRVLAVVLRWSRHWIRHELLIQPARLLWRQLGHAAPCDAVRRLLQRPHGPRVTACLRALMPDAVPVSQAF